MTDYNPGVVGIGGYYFQILTYISFLPSIQKSQVFGYEVFDDISITDAVQNNECVEILRSNKINDLIQVKRTDVDSGTQLKVLFNWMLEDDSEKYTLVIAKGYSCREDILITKSVQDLYKELKPTEKQSSLASRVHSKFKKENDFRRFERKINHIRSRLEIRKDFDPEDEILDKYESIFHSSQSSNYQARLDEFKRILSTKILDEAHLGKTFSIEKDAFLDLCDTVRSQITDSKYIRNYSLFEQSLNFQITSQIEQLREYKQLTYCDLAKNTIKNRLVEKLYYEDLKNYYLERNKDSFIKDVESSAYTNYTDAQEEVDDSKPKTLYLKTIKKKVDGLPDDQRYSRGSYIALSKENTEKEKRISWRIEDAD